MLSKAEIRDHYEGMAPRYDFWGWLTESQARARCLELAAIQNGEVVLEVAVGTGLAFQEILRRNPSGIVAGIYLTPGMLAQAQRKARATGQANYALQLGDAYHLPFAANSFDVLLSNYLFDLLPETDFSAVLAEFYRVLRPGGRLVLANMTTPWRWYQTIWRRAYTRNPHATGGCRSVSLAAPLQAAGFALAAQERLSQMTLPSEVLLARKAPN